MHELNAVEAGENCLQEDAASVAQMIRDDSYAADVDRVFALGKSLRNFGTTPTRCLNEIGWCSTRGRLCSQRCRAQQVSALE